MIYIHSWGGTLHLGGEEITSTGKSLCFGQCCERYFANCTFFQFEGKPKPKVADIESDLLKGMIKVVDTLKMKYFRKKVILHA